LAPAVDIVTIGRVSVDLYAREAGIGFEGAQTFEKSVGGSPTNVAVAAARLGRRAAVITKVGADPFGAYVRAKLESFGVDTRFVGTHDNLRTPLAFAAMDPAEDPPILFYREPNAPDMTVDIADVDLDAVVEAPIFWVSASALSKDPIASAVSAMLSARRRRSHTILDLDYRPTFWTSRAAAEAGTGAAIGSCTVAIGNRAECEVAVGTADPVEAARRLLDRGVHLAIVKQGGDGVLVATSDGSTTIPPHPVTVVCGLGAGDAFGGAVCHGLLAGWDPVRLVTFANVSGAIVASRRLCSDAMPFEHEVLERLEALDAAH
jgi:5-dehydro-2-deoxygluconokinase